jgi:hypothetical protein
MPAVNSGELWMTDFNWTRRHRLSLGEFHVEQEVDQHAGDGDVEPDRERPPGDALVLVETLTQGAGERDENQRDDGDGADKVGEENAKVNGPEPRRL